MGGLPPAQSGGLHEGIDSSRETRSKEVVDRKEPASVDKSDGADNSPRPSLECGKSDSSVDAPISEVESIDEEPVIEVDQHAISSCMQLLDDVYGERALGWRFIGRVAEFPIVREDGRAGDLAELWPFLKRELIDHGFEVHRERNGMFSALIGPEFSYRCGIGRGVVRIEIPQQADLFGVENALVSAMTPLVRVARSRRLRILAYGIHPVTPAGGGQLTHMYHLHSLLKAIGEPWASRAICARDSITISCSRDELLDQLNLGRLLEPLFYALFSNSAICSGSDSYHSNASQLSMDKMNLCTGRGAPSEGLFPDESSWLREVLAWRRLLKPDEEGWLEPFDEPLCGDMPSGEGLQEVFQRHLDCSWGPVRPKFETASLEWRAACQQPWEQRMTVSAFCLGLMENRTEFDDFLENFLPPPPRKMHFGLTMAQIIEKEMAEAQNPWPTFAGWRKKAIAYGLNSEEAFTGVLSGALAVAENGLISRGMGEERFIAPLLERVSMQSDHAEPLRRAFAREGMLEVLSRIEIPIPS